MEDNMADALKMAASVLMFVVALSITMSSFSNARKTTQTILEMKDREYDYTYVENATSTKRIVGAETIIPSMYRAYTENYKIVFLDENGDDLALYMQSPVNSSQEENYTRMNSIDLENEAQGSYSIEKDFIEAILYGAEAISESSITHFEKRGIKFFTKNSADDIITSSIPENERLCNIIKTTQFEESLGEYYQEDVSEEAIEPGTENSETVPESNKNKKRVITYKAVR